MKLIIKQRLPIVAIAAFTLFAASAQATHWPMTGNDPGRSGHQPADRPVLPLEFDWRYAEALSTSPIITSGADMVAQRVAWGHYTNNQTQTDLNGQVRIARLSNLSNATDTDIDDEQPRDAPNTGPSDNDTFGPADDVAPLEASSHTSGPAQIYAVHNDDNQENYTSNAGPPTNGPQTSPNLTGNDVAVAQIDVQTGTRIRDFAVGSNVPQQGQTSNGYTVESAPVIGPDDGTGTREIFFTIRSATEKRLVRVRIPNAASSGPHEFSSTFSPNIADLNTRARPAVMTMIEPDTGTPVSMVVLPTSDGIKTIRAKDDDLNDFGPSISGLGNTWSPSAPVQANGNMASRPTFFYVAGTSGGGDTVVYKLEQEPGEAGDESLRNLRALATSPELSGAPGPGLAVAQEIPLGTDTVPKPGRVVVGTTANMYSLSTENLGADNPPRLFNQDAADAASGFGQTIPATSGELGFAVTKAGTQFVFYLTPRNGSLRVPQSGFTQSEEGLNATYSIGQPALSRGRVVFGTNVGAFAYGPTVSIISPSPGSDVEGTTTLSAHVLDPNVATVVFKVDGVTVGSAAPVSNVATINWNSLSVPDGEHVVTAETADDKSAQRPFIVDNFGPPTAQLTVSPSIPNVGQDVTLNASGSAPTPGEPNDAIIQWAFEIDGDNDYNDIVEGAGGDGIVRTQFSTPGQKTVGVRVTDAHGDTAIATVSFRVNAPPTVTLAASPNPAAAGQQVTIDATGSTDSDGTITRYEFDLDGNNTFELDNGSNPKTTKAFAATTTVGVRVTDNNGGQTVQTVTVTVPPPNQPPVAAFIVAPNPALVGQDVGFSAAASKDPDGTITKYEWDFDGNGSFETPGGPLIARKFTTPGVIKVGLRVTDNAGATATSTVDLVISAARCVVGNRCTPRFTASVSPKRDRKLPFVFTTRGRVRLPSGVRSVDGCTGRVSVQVKRGKRTISNRRVRLSRSCRFTSKVTFRDRKRLGTAKSLRFSVRFLGNKVLKPRSTTVKTVRIG